MIRDPSPVQLLAQMDDPLTFVSVLLLGLTAAVLILGLIIAVVEEPKS